MIKLRHFLRYLAVFNWLSMVFSIWPNDVWFFPHWTQPHLITYKNIYLPTICLCCKTWWTQFLLLKHCLKMFILMWYFQVSSVGHCSSCFQKGWRYQEIPHRREGNIIITVVSWISSKFEWAELACGYV